MYRFVYFAKQRSEAFVFFKRLAKQIKRDTGNDIIKLHTDRGTEFYNKEFEEYLQDNAISHELSTVYNPQQNEYIERDNCTIMEVAQILIHEFHAKNLLTKLWAEVIHTAIYLLNQTINTQLGIVTPYEKYFKEKPIVDHYKVFGALVYVFKNKQQRSGKLDTKSFKGYFTSYSDTSKAYRFWNPLQDQIVESSDFRLDEYHGKYIAEAPPNPGIYNSFSMDFHFPNEDPNGVIQPILMAPVPIALVPVNPLQVLPPELPMDSTKSSTSALLEEPTHVSTDNTQY
jgi:hypothetical protein